MQEIKLPNGKWVLTTDEIANSYAEMARVLKHLIDLDPYVSGPARVIIREARAAVGEQRS